MMSFLQKIVERRSAHRGKKREREPHRTEPRPRDQKIDVRCPERRRPTQEKIEKKVIAEVPDGKCVEKRRYAHAAARRCEPANRDKHHDRRRFAPELNREDVRRNDGKISRRPDEKSLRI